MAVRSLKTKKGKSATSKATAREVLERYISVLEELTPGEIDAIKSTVTQLTEKIYPPPTFHAPATCLKLEPMTVPPALLFAHEAVTLRNLVEVAESAKRLGWDEIVSYCKGTADAIVAPPGTVNEAPVEVTTTPKEELS